MEIRSYAPRRYVFGYVDEEYFKSKTFKAVAYCRSLDVLTLHKWGMLDEPDAVSEFVSRHRDESLERMAMDVVEIVSAGIDAAPEGAFDQPVIAASDGDDEKFREFVELLDTLRISHGTIYPLEEDFYYDEYEKACESLGGNHEGGE